MTLELSPSLWQNFKRFIERELGLVFSDHRQRDLQRGITRIVRVFGFEDATAGLEHLCSRSLSPEQMEILAGHLTVGETYFFREQKVLEALENHILPALITARRHQSRRLRIWSAGCSTGEEPYTVAMLIRQLIPDLENWNITILATDLNQRALVQAGRGLFRKWSFRHELPQYTRQYFHELEDGQFEISPVIRRMVTFRYLNLAVDTYPSIAHNTNAMDVILCRNVLMYFTRDRARQVIDRFQQCLVTEGWLLVSPVETSSQLFTQFTSVSRAGTTLYQKDGVRPPAPGPAPQPGRLPDHPAVSQPPVIKILSEPPQSLRPAPLPATPDTGTAAGLDYATLEAGYLAGDYSSTAVYLKTYLEHHPGDRPALLLQARVYANQGHLAAARESCEQALNHDRLDPRATYLLATILLEQGEQELALRHLNQTIYLDPDFALAHFTLGNIYLQQNLVEPSHRHFRNTRAVLQRRDPSETLSEAEGITAGRLLQIVSVTLDRQIG